LHTRARGKERPLTGNICRSRSAHILRRRIAKIVAKPFQHSDFLDVYTEAANHTRARARLYHRKARAMFARSGKCVRARQNLQACVAILAALTARQRPLKTSNSLQRLEFSVHVALAQRLLSV
jgi:hypothetical protein